MEESPYVTLVSGCASLSIPASYSLTRDGERAEDGSHVVSESDRPSHKTYTLCIARNK